MLVNRNQQQPRRKTRYSSVPHEHHAQPELHSLDWPWCLCHLGEVEICVPYHFAMTDVSRTLVKTENLQVLSSLWPISCFTKPAAFCSSLCASQQSHSGYHIIKSLNSSMQLPHRSPDCAGPRCHDTPTVSIDLLCQDNSVITCFVHKIPHSTASFTQPTWSLMGIHLSQL